MRDLVQQALQDAGVARRFESSQWGADDLAQAVREKLFVGAQPRVAHYSGQGELKNWLKVTAVRVCMDAIRGRSAREVPVEGSTLDAIEAEVSFELEFSRLVAPAE